MLNPLVAAQSQLYAIQQNIDNAFNDSYHRRTVSTNSTQFSNYVDLTTTRSGDLFSDMQLYSAQSKQTASNQTATDLNNLSKWLDTWSSGKPTIATLNGKPEVQSSMDWYQTGIEEAATALQNTTSSLKNTLTTISSTLSSLASTNQATLDGQSGDGLKDIQSQLLSTLSQYMSVSARYDGNQLSVSLPSGEPLVLGTNASSLATTTSGLSLTFQKSVINLDSTKLVGTVDSMVKTKNSWSDTLDKISAARNDFAIKINSWNTSNGSSAAFNVDAGQLVSKVFNKGDISLSISLQGSISDLTSTALTDSTGRKIADTNNPEVISSLKISNEAGIFKIYTKSIESTEWALKESNGSLNQAIADFNSLGNQSVSLGSATINTASVSGDSWEWNANNSSVHKVNDTVQSISVGMKRTDNLTNTASLSFIGNDSDYTSTSSLNLTISSTGTLDGFPSGSTVRVAHSDGTYTDTTISGTTGPAWENGATYKYNGIKWTASGTSLPGNSWSLTKPTTVDSASVSKLKELVPTNLTNYQTSMGLSAKSASTKLSLDQTYYNNQKADWQATNGVNLDEEAQNLAKTQSWYQALAKSETIKNSLWTTLMNSM